MMVVLVVFSDILYRFGMNSSILAIIISYNCYAIYSKHNMHA